MHEHDTNRASSKFKVTDWHSRGISDRSGESHMLVKMSLSTTIDLQIADEIWHGGLMDYSTLRIFGYPAYSLWIVRRRISWSPSLETICLLDLLLESKDIVFGIWRLEALFVMSHLDSRYGNVMMTYIRKKPRLYTLSCKYKYSITNHSGSSSQEAT